MIGSTISHFRITAKLGEGGFGMVWRAEDTDLRRPVALKVLSADSIEREDVRARFMREARTAASLNHANICTIYEVGEVDGRPYIAMELIEGEGLDARLERIGPLPLRELIRIAVRVARAMAAAHARGIVHRDLKPANVMLTEDGGVKVLDFGLAKPTKPTDDDGRPAPDHTITAEMTKAGTIVGTIAYMSPEQAEGKTVDSRSDVFSFGVMLYQMTTGRLPFRGDTSASTLAKILETDPPSLSGEREGLPADLHRIVSRSLSKRPADRYNDTRDLVADLQTLQTTAETQAYVRPRKKRGPIWIAATALALVVVVALWAFRPWQTSDTGSAATAAVAVSSIAVLPFHNLSADPDNEYFSDGMTEEIISKLSRIDALEVASRSSVEQYKDRARNVQQIGKVLGVRYLLDGSVRRAGDQVRVSAQLVDSTTGRNIWSEDFDGSLHDVFGMQEQTALQIADRLNLRLSPEEQVDVKKRGTENVAAYDAYLRGVAMSRNWGVRAGLEAAATQFNLALKLDPDYAPALAGLAYVECDMYRNFDTSEHRIRRAEELARRAAELDPTMADASHALAIVAANRFDYERASELLRETVRIAPKVARYWDNLSWSLAYETPPDGRGAVDAAMKALELQPHYPGAYYHLGRGLIAMGRYDEALDAFETMIEQDPDWGARQIAFAQYYLAVGDYSRALEELARDAVRDNVMTNYYRAAAQAASGAADDALATLTHTLDQGYRDFVNLEASPYFASLRQDPRYQELMRRYED